jgi:hypothetical protein
LKEKNAPELMPFPRRNSYRISGNLSRTLSTCSRKSQANGSKPRQQTLAALNEYQDRCGALTAEMGLQEADDLAEKSHDQIMGILERIEAIKPETLRGLQAKAKNASQLVLGGPRSRR